MHDALVVLQRDVMVRHAEAIRNYALVVNQRLVGCHTLKASHMPGRHKMC